MNLLFLCSLLVITNENMELQNREIYTKRIKPYVDKGIIKVLTGQRRVGKSCVLLQLINEIKAGNSRANVIYINKESDEFSQIKTDVDLSAYVKKNLVTDTANYLFIDEIQDITHFENTLRSLQADDKCDIFCTGSNAKMLSSELATYLSGRYIEFHIHPLSYTEFLQFHRLENNDDTLKKFLVYGGMPHLARLELSDDIAFEYLRNVYSTILLKDVVSRENIRNVDFLGNLVDFLADNVGSLVSAGNIHKFLKSQRIDMSVNAIVNYLKALSNAYIINKVQRIDVRGMKKFEINDKYYFEDLGLRNCRQHLEFQSDTHKLLENAVYQHLKMQNYQVYVGKLFNSEIDFVGIKGNEKIYVQVTYLIGSEATHEREFGNLLKIDDSYPKYVVSMDFAAGSNFKGIKHIHIKDFLMTKEF
jgi:predicted AAA+ superfamily ATPase